MTSFSPPEWPATQEKKPHYKRVACCLLDISKLKKEEKEKESAEQLCVASLQVPARIDKLRMEPAIWTTQEEEL